MLLRWRRNWHAEKLRVLRVWIWHRKLRSRLADVARPPDAFAGSAAHRRFSGGDGLSISRSDHQRRWHSNRGRPFALVARPALLQCRRRQVGLSAHMKHSEHQSGADRGCLRFDALRWTMGSRSPGSRRASRRVAPDGSLIGDRVQSTGRCVDSRRQSCRARSHAGQIQLFRRTRRAVRANVAAAIDVASSLVDTKSQVNQGNSNNSQIATRVLLLADATSPVAGKSLAQSSDTIKRSVAAGIPWEIVNLRQDELADDGWNTLASASGGNLRRCRLGSEEQRYQPLPQNRSPANRKSWPAV